MYIPNSEKYDENGNVTHFGIVDPEHGPILIPNVGGNHGMFTAAYGGGSGAQELHDTSAGGGGAASQELAAAQAARGDAPISDIGGGFLNGVANAGSTEMALRGQGAIPVEPPQAPHQVLGVPPVPGGDGPTNTQDNGPAPGWHMPASTGTDNQFDTMKTHKDSSTQAKLDPAEMGAFNKQTELGAQATESEHKALIAENQVRQAQAEAASNAIAEHQQATDAARATYQSNLEKKQLEIQADTDKFMNTPIDTNHFWADKGTGDKVMAGIAIALGALGGAMSGTNGNVGLDIINKSIERDLKVQEMNMQKQGQAIGLKRGLLSDYMSQFGDMEKAKEASFIAYQKGVAQHFESMAGAAKDEGTKANGMKMAAAIRADAALKTAELTKKTVTQEDISAPTIKYGKASDKTQEKVNQLSRGLQKNTELQQLIKGNPDQMGRVAGGESLLKSWLNLPQNATRQDINFGMKTTILNDLQAAGRVNPEKSALIKQLDDNPNMNVPDALNLLKNHAKDMQAELDMEVSGARGRREILNVPQMKQSTADSNAELKRNRK